MTGSVVPPIILVSSAEKDNRTLPTLGGIRPMHSLEHRLLRMLRLPLLKGSVWKSITHVFIVLEG